MRLTTLGPFEGSVSGLCNALGRALSSLGEPAQLLLLYLPIDADHQAYLDGIRAVTDTLVIGATTGGAAFTERGFTERGAVLGILSGPERIPSELVTGLRATTQERVQRATQALVSRHRRESKTPLALMVLADAYACDGEVLARAIRDAAPAHARIYGATAGDSFTFTETRVFYRDRAYTDAAVLLAMPHPAGADVRALHGFCTVENARDMLVTEIEGNVLKTLDHVPAAQAYRGELMRLGLMRPGDDLLTQMGIYELAARSILDEGSLRIRTALNLVGDHVVLASGVEPGSVVKVAAAAPEQLIEAARRLSRETLTKLPEVNGALVFDCAARRKLLGLRYREQVAAFGSARSVPYIGFASYGELARGTGQLTMFHNTTAVMVAF